MGWNTSNNVTEAYCLNMVAEAIRQKCWIMAKGKWYTPNEFSDHVYTNQSQRQTEFESIDIKLVEPFNAILKLQNRLDEKKAAIEDEQRKINDFAVKVARYYKDLK